VGTPLGNLRSILSQQRVNAVSAMGAASETFPSGSPEWHSQRVVSFRESPLEQLHTFFIDFDETRRHRFEPYGLAFTKMKVRRKGAVPVWYTDMTWASPSGSSMCGISLNERNKPTPP
jgi:hypothetical protein